MNLRRALKHGEYVIVVPLFAPGGQPFYVVSLNPSSMSPTVNYGDVGIVYHASSFTSLEAGDIVVFKDPRGNPRTTIHRIVVIWLASHLWKESKHSTEEG